MMMRSLANELDQNDGYGPDENYPGKNAWNHKVSRNQLLIP